MILSKRKNLMSIIQKTVKASASLEIGERKVECRSRFPRPNDGDRRNQDFAGTKVTRRPQRLNCQIRGSHVGGPDAARFSFSAVVLLGLSIGVASQTPPRPLRASEALALEAGGVLPANVAHEIDVRGLN